EKSTLSGTCPIVPNHGTTAMLPLSHCLYVSPALICGPESFHASSRFFRWTAVRMNRPATRFASCGTGTLFAAGCTVAGFPVATGVELAAGFDVCRKWTIRHGTIPATRTRPEIHGARRAKRRAVFRRAGYADTHPE